mgnify:FL=1
MTEAKLRVVENDLSISWESIDHPGEPTENYVIVEGALILEGAWIDEGLTEYLSEHDLEEVDSTVRVTRWHFRSRGDQVVCSAESWEELEDARERPSCGY